MRRAGAILLAVVGLACLPAAATASAPPTIEYLTPHPVRNHQATLWFNVDPKGLATTYQVEYGREAGNYLPTHENFLSGELPAEEGPVLEEVRVPSFFDPEMLAGTEYHWRVVAKNAAGTTEGPDEVFTTTDGAPPRTFTFAATDQTLSSAVLHGEINPEGLPVTGCWFQVVPERTIQNKGWSAFDTIENNLFGTLVPCVETPEEIGTGAGHEQVLVHATITNLQAEPYEVRLEGSNEYEDQRYSEPALIGPVQVKTLGSDPMGASEATVHGSLYKQYHGEAAYWVEYGIGGLGHKTDIGWLGALGREYALEATLPCLQPNSEYTYRFAGMNAAGTVHGSEGSFHTAAGEPGCSGGFVTQPISPAGQPPSAPATSSQSSRQKHKHRRHHKPRS